MAKIDTHATYNTLLNSCNNVNNMQSINHTALSILASNKVFIKKVSRAGYNEFLLCSFSTSNEKFRKYLEAYLYMLKTLC